MHRGADVQVHIRENGDDRNICYIALSLSGQKTSTWRGRRVAHRGSRLEHQHGGNVFKRICEPHSWVVQEQTLFHSICVVVSFVMRQATLHGCLYRRREAQKSVRTRVEGRFHMSECWHWLFPDRFN